MSRPSDHIDSRPPAPITQPELGLIGYARFFWRQLTSMRTALFLLLLLALAAIPGSLWPQRSSDPNGVVQYFDANPGLAPVLDGFQLFDVYGSVWFSAIYLLLFVSLIGCVIPRTMHHLKALRSRPPRTPARLERLEAFTTREVSGEGASAQSLVDSARDVLARRRYRVELFEARGTRSVSAERGYLRETGNLVFHTALLGVLVSVGFGGGFAYNGQKVIIEGAPFVHVLGSYDSFNPGRFFDETDLEPFVLTLDKFEVDYEEFNLNAYGTPQNFRASVTARYPSGEESSGVVRVNHPFEAGGTKVYLLGNGYAPTITVRDGEGNIAFNRAVPFLPQDANLTSLGVVKAPDGLPEQLGMIGFFYPTVGTLASGAYASAHADVLDPLLTLRVYTGDLGLDDGIPISVFTLDTDDLTEIVGGDSGVETIELRPGETAELPDGLGSVTFESVVPSPGPGNWDGAVKRFASFDLHHNPSEAGALVFAVLALLGLLCSLFVPRRRVWVKATNLPGGGVRLEYAGLARGDDPGLADAVTELADTHGGRVEQ